jgi:hypothetical protein
MLRVVVILVAVPGCVLGGVVGALTGVCIEFQWPLSEENLAYTIRWGVTLGAGGAILTVLVLCAVPREKLWPVGSLGPCVTFLLSVAGMWWDIVTSLG